MIVTTLSSRTIPVRDFVCRCIFTASVLLLAATPGLRSAPASELSVGYGQVDVTAPLGTTMPGYFHERRATEVLDPLLAKALVLTKGESTLAIVAIDLIGIRAPLAGTIRSAVQEATGISPDHVFLHATHTHTGATVAMVQDRLPAQVAAAVKQALDKRTAEPRVRLGAAEERRVAFIRRYLMRDGSVRTNPGRSNPAVVRPIGDIDPAVRVLVFDTAKVVLVNYALHPDCVSGTRFSADYPHHITETLRGRLGAAWNVLYLNGCCGNVNHVDVNNPKQRSSYEESRRIGRAIGETAHAACARATPISVDRLAARTETVSCAARTVPEAMRTWAEQQLRDDTAAASKRKFNEATPSRILALAKRAGTTQPAEIIAMRIGPVGLVGLPAEVFVEIARDIQTHSLLDPTLVIGLTGGSMGYLPHPRGYREGGYEATFASARYAPETGIAWSEAAARMLKEMQGEE